MEDFTDFSEASLLYADNYYLVERLEQIFKKEQEQLFQVFRERIQEKEWMATGKWKINISGTYFEFKYQAEQGKEPFYISLRFSIRDLANKNKEEGKEGERRNFEIALATRNSIGDLGEFRDRFFKSANAVLENEFEKDKEYYPTRRTMQTLVRRKAEYSLQDLLNSMETEMEVFIKIAEYAMQSLKIEG
jgi:hypothetical protein